MLTIIVLLIFGFCLLFMEIFVPGGILGVIGTIMMGVAVWLCFDYGKSEGFAVLLFCLIVTILTVYYIFKQFPNTAVGKWVLLADQVSKEKGYHSDSVMDKNLLDKVGISESELRPSGIALLEGERYDVVTEGEFIESNTAIRVIRVDANRIVVEQA